MAWLAVDENEKECIFETKPIRNRRYNIWRLQSRHCMCGVINLPKGTIEKIIGRSLTWEDCPVKI